MLSIFFCRSAEAGKKLRIINCTKFSIFEEFERRVGEKSQLRLRHFLLFLFFCCDLRALTRPTGRWELIAKTTHRALIQFREFEETFPTTQRAVKKKERKVPDVHIAAKTLSIQLKSLSRVSELLSTLEVSHCCQHLCTLAITEMIFRTSTNKRED